jgi:hypothetical protein
MASSFTGSAHSPFPGYDTILIELNIKKRTGPALCVLCGWRYSTFNNPRLEISRLTDLKQCSRAGNFQAGGIKTPKGRNLKY